MWANPQENMNLFPFTEEILNGKFNLVCVVWCSFHNWKYSILIKLRQFYEWAHNFKGTTKFPFLLLTSINLLKFIFSHEENV